MNVTNSFGIENLSQSEFGIEPRYKIRARGYSAWKDFDTVRLEISVGKPYHEGAKMKAALEWAHKNFKNVAVIIGDLPQRYNLMFDESLNEEEATRKALDQGAAWIARHAVLLDQYENVNVYRWSFWKDSEAYINTRWKVGRLYRDNERFRSALESSIEDVWSRRSQGQEFSIEERARFFNNSVNYLLEETSVFSMAFESLPGISAYPGSFLEMWNMFVDHDIAGAPKGLNNAHCLRLSFLRV